MEIENGVADLSSSYVRLQSLLLATTGLDRLLQQMTMVAATMVDPPLGCGITVRRDGLPLTVASSDERASSLDESQYVDGRGPCLHTLASGHRTWYDDAKAYDTRWPLYGAQARQQGLVCSLSLPLDVDGNTVAAMNLYSFADPEVFTAEVVEHSLMFAAHASTALQLGLGRISAVQIRDELEQALSSRTTIDQAIGIMIGQQHCTAEEAFDLLRRRSQSSNVPLRDVAADVITRASGQPPQPGREFRTD